MHGIPPPARETACQASFPDNVEQDVVRDDTFWYEDGNVIIKVENTHFKLLRSRLARYSQYFATLFSTPLRSVYEISNVTLTDFRRFLTALEQPLYVAGSMTVSACALTLYQ